MNITGIKNKIKILLVEDNKHDVKLLDYQLQDSGLNYEMKVVDTEAEYLGSLEEYSPDLIISDYKLPTFNGMAALNIAVKSYPLIPFIISTGSINEEVAVECIKAGADDYVLKEQIKRIGAAIDGAIKKKLLLKEKLQAEEALRQSEKKFRLLAYNSRDLIFRYQLYPEHQYEFVSPSCIELIGYTPEEHYAEPYLYRKILHQDDKQKFDDMIFTDKYFYKPVELRWQHKNGYWIWGEQIIIPIYNSDQKLIAIEGTARDITERKKAEFIIRKKEKELRTLTQNLPDIISRFDRNKRHLFINESIESITGIPVSEFIGKTNEELGMPEENLKVWNEKIELAFNSGIVVSYYFSFETEKGKRVFETRLIPEISEDGSIQTILSIVRDVTEDVKNQELILKANEQFRAVWENSFEAMRLTDSEGMIIRANDALCRLYDKPREEIEGKLFMEFYKCSPDTLQKYKERFINRSFESKLEREIELLNGKKIWLHLSSSFIEMKDQPVLLLSIFRDFTENKIAEIETLNAKEKAEEINRLKSSFLANMSHELRTPLIGILGFAEILKNEIEDSSLSEYADTIYLSGKRLAETLNSILDFSTIESEKKKKNFVPLNVVEIINDIVESNLKDAKEKNLTLEFKYTRPVIHAKLDKVMFSQVINNVLNNAIKFTVKGGITVSTSVEQIDNESCVRIEVIDSGIGIPEKFSNVIFEPFRQGSEGLNRNYQGTGLGLTIAKKYTELMDGKISVRSKNGIGSIFIIEFPAISVIEHKESTVKLEKTITAPMEKPLLAEIPDILLVEDDQTNQLAVKYFLSGIVQLDIANNGETAVQMAKTVKYALILMDIGLKGEMNGLETAKVIRKIDGYRDIPIVAVSAFVMDGDKERFLNEGCTHYLPKPFLRGDLVKMVRSILNLS